MATRFLPVRNPVTIRLDGEEVVAERGEPIAAALIAADKIAIARSPKFHRPRGPACFRAACDGCLARVNGEPNVMTCLVPAEDGDDVRTQNTLGSREVDLLRMTDWFFPKGMNHHELFAGVPGVQRIMQSFARRVAGLGKLPQEVTLPRAARRRSLDALVVGAGPSGMAAALALVDAKRAVEIVDDAPSPGGGVRALVGDEGEAFRPLVRAFAAAVDAGAIVLRSRTTAAALYGDDLLALGPDGAEVLTAQTLVIATGAHDGALAFEGNDLPGVLGARAAGWLLAGGIALGTRVVVVVAPGQEAGPFGEAFARAAGRGVAEGASEVHLVRGTPVRAEGSGGVKAVVVAVPNAAGQLEETRLLADALVIDAPRAPSYELPAQAGAALVHTPRGFVPRTERSRVRDGVFVVGEAAGAPFDLAAFERAAAEVVAQT